MCISVYLSSEINSSRKNYLILHFIGNANKWKNRFFLVSNEIEIVGYFILIQLPHIHLNDGETVTYRN